MGEADLLFRWAKNRGPRCPERSLECGIKSIPTTLKTHKSDPNVEPIRYRSNLEKFEGVRVRAVDFNAVTKNADRSATFITQALFPEVGLAEDIGVTNAALSWPAARFLFRMNRVVRDRSPELHPRFPGRKKILNRVRRLDGPRFRLSHLDTPVDLSELAYVRERFGITWPVPTVVRGTSHRLEDLMVGFTKQEAQALDHHVGPVLPTIENAAVRECVKQTLRGLTKPL